MKKLGCSLLALILAFTLCACTQEDSNSQFAALPPADQTEKYFCRGRLYYLRKWIC